MNEARIEEIRREVGRELDDAVNDIYTKIHDKFGIECGDAFPDVTLAVDDALDEVRDKMMIILTEQIKTDEEHSKALLNKLNLLNVMGRSGLCGSEVVGAMIREITDEFLSDGYRVTRKRDAEGDFVYVVTDEGGDNTILEPDYLGEPKNDWIPTSEREPNDDEVESNYGEFTVCIDGAEQATALYFDPQTHKWYDLATGNEYKVTYWQFFPKPPKD